MNVASSAELLDLPASRACRVVALDLLAQAAAEHARLGDPGDEEALHDFRVAVRRLRSWLRAFRPWLEESVTKKMRARLRDVASATNASRDAEVHIEWIQAQHESLTTRQRTGARWLEQRLSTAKLTADSELYQTVANRFMRVHGLLERSLGEYTVRVSLNGPAGEPRFSRIMAALIREHAAELREHLGRVHAPSDEKEGHRARILGKRLRYLLEPISETVPEAAALVASLKELQDAMGDVNDAHVFAAELTTALQESAAEQARVLSHSVLAATDHGAELRRARGRDPRPGLVALARLLRERGDAAFARVQEEWLGDASDPFFAAAEALAASLEERHAAGVEIERKYLLTGLPPRVEEVEPAEVEQGYIPGDRLVERLRQVRRADRESWIRTVKAGAGLTRFEVEEETSARVFRRMWPLTRGKRVTKRRYAVPDGNRIWEIDEFTDRDLVLAEVELPHADAKVTFPEWLEPFVVREVTGEREYLNSVLAK